MSDFLDQTFHQSQDNVFGGHDFQNADGGYAGRSQPNVFGGHDVQDAHGNRISYTQPNVFGGVDVHGANGTLEMQTRAGVAGTGVYGSEGQYEGRYQETFTGVEYTDLHGIQSSWQNNVLGGVTADPMSQVRSLVFPPLL